jgi:hypothetical protein
MLGEYWKREESQMLGEYLDTRRISDDGKIPDVVRCANARKRADARREPDVMSMYIYQKLGELHMPQE